MLKHEVSSKDIELKKMMEEKKGSTLGCFG